MMTPVDGTERTRWDELCSIVKIVLEIGTIFDSNGVDIFFLNRQAFLNITDPIEVDQAFAGRPSGFTPLAPALRSIFKLPAAHRGHDKKLLVFIATDGAPTDEKGNSNLPELERVMRDERQSETTHVMFLLCTDDPACVDYLNQWDRTMVHVDVTDDFRTEREKIRRYRGPNYPFSLGEYIIKALIGAIDQEIDNLNEPGLTQSAGGQ
ncbi:unnamed protein product [Didymodactylos carnosus]|uniref:VWFA domain-containing protein n=1 Tax=Didymodactylos carnosus TaxID=1234261 RepID=A0A815UAL5_9BILA|nr:unnamed protein product [Didymodactylos carnosus]CAF4379382.1 unnamed protein product [Didymodactylos carnosus]